MSGFSPSDFQGQIDALRFLKKEILIKVPQDAWALGGGTALSLFYFNHRLSFDVDLIVSNLQYMSFLSPKTYIDDIDKLRKEYIDLAHHIRITTTKDIKIDILFANKLTTIANHNLKIGSLELSVEDKSEILAKKLKYRKSENVARDIFDLAIGAKKEQNLLLSLLKDKAIAIDDLFEWNEKLEQVDNSWYLNEIEKVKPYDEYIDIGKDAINIIQKEISRAKNEYLE